MEITREIALKMIESRPVIEQAMVPYKGIEVAYVGFTDAEGEPFIWEGDNGGEYAIVSFNATNDYKFNESVEAFKNEDYDEAVNNRLSMRMDADKAREICKGMLGTLICHTILNSEDIEILVPKNFTPIAAVVAKKRSLSDILAKSDTIKAGA